MKELLEKLKNIQRYNTGAWPDGTPDATTDIDGEWVRYDDLEDIVKELEKEIQ